MTKKLESFKTKNMDRDTIFRAFAKRKKSGKLLLYLQSAKELEKFFQNQRTGESSNWGNRESYHSYYKKSAYEDYPKADEYFSKKYNKFGGNLVSSSGKVNLGFLRTVGLSDGVEFELEAKYSEETIENSIRSIKDVVEEIYDKFIREVSVQTEVDVKKP